MFLRRIKEISLDPDDHVESFFWFHVFLFGWEKGEGVIEVAMGPESWGNGISTPEMPGGLGSDQQRHLHFES